MECGACDIPEGNTVAVSPSADTYVTLARTTWVLCVVDIHDVEIRASSVRYNAGTLHTVRDGNESLLKGRWEIAFAKEPSETASERYVINGRRREQGERERVRCEKRESCWSQSNNRRSYVYENSSTNTRITK